MLARNLILSSHPGRHSRQKSEDESISYTFKRTPVFRVRH